MWRSWLHCCDACDAGPNQECSVILFRSSRVAAAFSGPARRVWGRAPRRACFFLCPDGISFLCRAEVKSIGAARPAHRGRLARTGRQSCTSVGRFGACGAAFGASKRAKPPFTGHRVLVRLSHNSGRFSRRYPLGLIPPKGTRTIGSGPAGCAHLKAQRLRRRAVVATTDSEQLHQTALLRREGLPRLRTPLASAALDSNG